jgi:hypothetical protein
MTSNDEDDPRSPDGAVMLPPFYSAYSKAHWATHHINHFDASLRHYVEKCIRGRIEQPDGPDGEKVVHIETDPFNHAAVSLVIGDVMRNLRDALDHGISGIFRVVLGAGADERIHFPTGNDRNDLVGRVDATFKDTRLEHVADAILYEIKPTPTENLPIWALKKVTNSDKHRQFIINTQIVHTPMLNFASSRAMVMNNVIGIVPGSNYYYQIPADAVLTENSDLETTLKVSFGPSEVFARAAVVPTLIDCSKAVFDCLNKLQAAFAKI